MSEIHTHGLIEVVFGPSSVGKSTFIVDQKKQGGIYQNSLVVFPEDFEALSEKDRSKSIVVHYNALRPFSNKADNFPGELTNDPLAKTLFLKNRVDSIIVLVAKPSTIKKRALLRLSIEPVIGLNSPNYPFLAVFDFLTRIDISKVYKKWFDFFNLHKIKMKFFSTEADGGYLDSIADAISILESHDQSDYNDFERDTVLKRFEFPYQSHDGKHREATFNAIRPYLVGDSALDVGCAEGHFCFKLEQLGFQDIVGTDLKQDRFLAACVLKELNKSRCHFLMEDVLENTPTRTYDTILLLNVLHHLKNPIGALTILSKMCNHRLIIEYPNLDDLKFNNTIQRDNIKFNKLPLIGVSCTESEDQTFVFTDAALKRICVDNGQLFEKISFLQSPMSSSRRIAICQKEIS
jgi:2-polyprenyl-3-methyl-5-hydroxy-6-metoxy-1,4-benzoquinol methylase